MSDAFEVAWTLLKSNPRFQAFDLNPITMGTHPDLPRLGSRLPILNLGTVDPNVMAMAVRQGHAARSSRQYPGGIGQDRVSRMMNDVEGVGSRYPLSATPTRYLDPSGSRVGLAGPVTQRMSIMDMHYEPPGFRDKRGFEGSGSNQISRMPRPHAEKRLAAPGTPQSLLNAYKNERAGLAQLEREFGRDRDRYRYPRPSPFDMQPE
mgnify:CR=1 FL=1